MTTKPYEARILRGAFRIPRFYGIIPELPIRTLYRRRKQRGRRSRALKTVMDAESDIIGRMLGGFRFDAAGHEARMRSRRFRYARLAQITGGE